MSADVHPDLDAFPPVEDRPPLEPGRFDVPPVEDGPDFSYEKPMDLRWILNENGEFGQVVSSKGCDRL